MANPVDNLIGIYWKIFSCCCFAGVNCIVRYLSGGSLLPMDSPPLSVPMLVFWQNALAALMLVPYIVLKGTSSLKTVKIRDHFIRLLFALIGVSFWFLTLKYMPLAEAVALCFVSPAISILFACLFLREKILPSQVCLTVLAFLGVALITRPDICLADGLNRGWVVIYPIISAAAFVVSKVMTRKLAAEGESSNLLTLYLILFLVPISLPSALIAGWQLPRLEHLPLLLVLAGITIAAYYSFNKAYTYSNISRLLPVGGVKFVMSVALGFVVFNEIPTKFITWLGIALVCASTLTQGISFSKKYQPATTS